MVKFFYNFNFLANSCNFSSVNYSNIVDIFSSIFIVVFFSVISAFILFCICELEL